MDFEGPSEAKRIKRAVDDFIDREVAPSEEQHSEFPADDYQRYVVDDEHRQVPGHREVVEPIRKRSAEPGADGTGMPEEVGVGGRGRSHPRHRRRASRQPAARLPRRNLRRDRRPGPILPAADEEQREEYLDPLVEGEITTGLVLTDPEHGSDPHYVDVDAEKAGDQ